MNIKKIIKGLVYKKPNSSPVEPVKSEASNSTSQATENPYLNARITWNNIMQDVISTRQAWQIFCILAMLIAFAAVGGVVHIGSQSKIQPYVLFMNEIGETIRAVSVDKLNSNEEKKVIHSDISNFIFNARLVTADVILQKKAIFDLYSMLSPNDPATKKMNEWLKKSSPLKKAETETVTIEIKSTIPQTDTTWQIDWIETVRDREGVLKEPPFKMRAILSVYKAETTSATTEDHVRKNALNLYVKDYSWSKIN